MYDLIQKLHGICVFYISRQLLQAGKRRGLLLHGRCS
jgi:hypothetical protein